MKRIAKYWINKFVSGMRGFVWLFKEEVSIWFHFLTAIIVITLGVILNISISDWIILSLTIGMVIAFEMVNSSLESIVDLVSFQYNINAKKVKDIGAAATLFTAIVSIVVGLAVFIPYFTGAAG